MNLEKIKEKEFDKDHQEALRMNTQGKYIAEFVVPRMLEKGQRTRDVYPRVIGRLGVMNRINLRDSYIPETTFNKVAQVVNAELSESYPGIAVELHLPELSQEGPIRPVATIKELDPEN